jgi:hypothetical protein
VLHRRGRECRDVVLKPFFQPVEGAVVEFLVLAAHGDDTFNVKSLRRKDLYLPIIQP